MNGEAAQLDLVLAKLRDAEASVDSDASSKLKVSIEFCEGQR